MCEHYNKCGAYARMLHAATGFCPYGTDASDATRVNKNNAVNASAIKSPIIESKAAKRGKFGTGKPQRKWVEVHSDQLKIE